jgi:hypothetical protein
LNDHTFEIFGAGHACMVTFAVSVLHTPRPLHIDVGFP